MFGLKKRKSNEDSLSFPSLLATDIHAHLLPGVDDGPKTIQDALQLIKGLADLGYNKLVATSHVMSELYPNKAQELQGIHGEICSQIQERGISVELLLGAEYFLDPNFFELIEAKNILSFHENYVLVEMSTLSPFPEFHKAIFQLKTNGFKPILAHPERYTYFHNDLDQFERIKNMGCLLQVNLLSFQGYYGKKVKNCALKLLNLGMVDFLGTDLHHKQHLRLLEKFFLQKKNIGLLSNYSFLNAQI